MDLFSFLTWQFVLFSLGVMTVIFVLRTFLQYFIAALPKSKTWNNLIMPIAPIIIGGAMGLLLKAYPYATGLTSSGDHVLFGAIAGLLSGFIYKTIKGSLGSQIQSLATSMGITLPATSPSIPNTPVPVDAPPPNR